MPPIEFWFDYVSHNAYLGWHSLQSLAHRHQRPILAQPVVFAGLLTHYGTKGPAELKEKNLWMIKNVLRKAQRAQIPLKPPHSHPFNPLLSLRTTLAVTDPEQRNRLVSTLFTAIWAEGRDPCAPKTIIEAAARAELDGPKLIAIAEDPDTKDALHGQTRQAIRHGIFGVPSFVVGGEVFWGYDDLEYLDLHLAGQDPLASALIQPWLKVRPSARRRQRED